MRKRDHDLAGDGLGSFLSERRRLARLLGLSEELPERKPLPPVAEKQTGRVVPLKWRRP